MNIGRLTAVIITTVLVMSCDSGNHIPGAFSGEGPAHVEMHLVDGRYRLIVNGEEFFVKGAGCEFGPCYQVAAHGGNAIRTWRTDNGQRSAMEILDEAHDHGLMVLMGLDIGSERHGFDYNDTEAVARQLEEVREEIRLLKDHPALLGWGIGNELNLHYTNLKVWNAVNDIARMIREEDGNHVITTMLAGIGKKEVEYISENCPDLDFLSVQMYGDIINLGKRLEEAGYTGPYLVTEWGATGHWEVASTEWGSPIEQTSSEKADAIKERYKEAILNDDARCMGSFVFLWGQKQERTPSWYGLFTESGEKMEAINVMEYLWTGREPEHNAPRLTDIKITGKGGRYDNVFLESETLYKVEITVDHPEKEMLSVRAEIMPEPVELSVGGDFEKRPESMGSLVLSADIREITFIAPKKPGAYRVLVYVTDDQNNAGTANIPFFVGN
jgi:hypothetical protein